ncbi:MAG: energy-coupling factor ABC transporter ATP-binding protein [Spirochaetaceae bacterium]|jgi:cobalt/nickel transport system ATP-binding protein|nr:energy-coupling factor ABC transporter ATP-binding protein [Spirochaetaceae bacterium]
MAVIVAAKEIEVVYPGSTEGHVLDGVSFAAGKGEKIALIGANGAGKSTLLLALVGILPLHSGEITLNNITLDGTKHDRKKLAAVRRAAGLLFQNPDDQLFMSTVWEDVLFGPLNYLAEEKADIKAKPTADAAAKRKAIEDESLRTLDELGIRALKDKMPHKLSGGEKRLAALAAVLVMKPEILLMDEPSAFLDPRAQRRLTGILKSLPQTLLLATHDFSLARELCPRSLVISHGHIRADGSTEEILSNAKLLDECGL